MDSGNEVIIVDDIVTTNGFSGNCNEVIEMKTRSKGVEEELSTKSKLRSSKASSTQKDEKQGSEKEKMNLRSSVDMKADIILEDKTSITKEGITSRNCSVDTKSYNLSKKSKPSDSIVEEKTSTPSKKKSTEDDSGVNSRASSVSVEDSVVPRMRTRSSKISDAIASTSTPSSSKRISNRMPLSSYDFDEDYDVTLSVSLKRKAPVVYVEEMDDEAENSEETSTEPLAKRVAISNSFGLFNKLWYPFKTIYGIMSLTKSPEKAEIVGSATVLSAETSNEIDTVLEEGENIVQIDNDIKIDEKSAQSSTCGIM